MNKYLLRGLIGVIVGILAVLYGVYLMNNGDNAYKWVMSLGVLLFGLGFLLVMYSLFRKMDRRTINQYRKEQHRPKI